MVRPIDISKLLNKKKQNAVSKTSVQNVKASLARKITLEGDGNHSPSDIVHDNSKDELYSHINIVPNHKRKIQEESVDNNEEGSDNTVKSKKTKFQFDWDSNEDTMANYKPLVSHKYDSLLQDLNERDNQATALEQSLMGKHWKEKELSEMTERDWRILKEDFNISTKGSAARNPLRNWNDDNIIPKEILSIIETEFKFIEPSPIQRIAIPNMQSMRTKNGRDVCGIAATGSGKTMAFLIPIVTMLMKVGSRPIPLKIRNGPKSLILVPTRELAKQCHSQAVLLLKYLQKLKNDLKFNSVSIVGGHSYEESIVDLRNGCDILVATPGRLIDLVGSHNIVLNDVSILVLDEADKMVDLGFEEQLTTVLSNLNSSVISKFLQTVMFTATLTPNIERIIGKYLTNPVYATIKRSEGTIPKIQQIVEYSTDDSTKFEILKTKLPKFSPPIIIFVNYKRSADWLFDKFRNETHLKVSIIHGSKSQEQREQSLKLLRSGKVQVLIATNVAARGIDIPNVSLVVNYQMSKHFEDYIHRIGRTARAGQNGVALTFLGNEEDPKLVIELYKYLRNMDITKSNIFPNTLVKLYGIDEVEKGKANIIH